MESKSLLEQPVISKFGDLGARMFSKLATGKVNKDVNK